MGGWEGVGVEAVGGGEEVSECVWGSVGLGEYVLEDVAGGAVFGVDERFGLGVAVG